MKFSLDIILYLHVLLSHWLEENNLFLNLKKTAWLLFGTKQRVKIIYQKTGEDFSVTLDRASSKFSTVFKCLGVMLDNHLTYNDSI